MNLDDAIKTHSLWTHLLDRYLDRPDFSLGVQAVASADLCELGEWLNGDGKKYANIPEFTELVAGHRRFHQAAADVISQANSGQAFSRELFLGSGSAFAAASREVLDLLLSIKNKL